MIALKDDHVWVKLSVFDNPFPPFDWGSGMGLEDIGRKEAVKLGLIDDKELSKRVAKKREEKPVGFNGKLQAELPMKDDSPEAAKLKAVFGDLVRIDNGVAKWRPEILKETVMTGKNFEIDIGVPDSRLLEKLASQPSTAGFAEAIKGKPLTIDQTWRDTKASNGGTHIKHFKPNKKQPSDIPLVEEDFEMVPSMWRNPSRVLKLRSDLFSCELDAFDGSTYVMQISIAEGSPKFWTFFKTKNPTSKKIARGNLSPTDGGPKAVREASHSRRTANIIA